MKAILTYHSIDETGSVVSVSPDRFREHLDVLVTKRVPVLPLEEIEASADREAVAITFDDGFVNFLEVALPLLNERGFTATVFVATDRVGESNDWDPTDSRIPILPLMGWGELAELVGRGVEIGSHTKSHARLPRLSDDELADEVEGPLEEIGDRLGVVPTSFAYPYGDHDARVVEAVRSAGYARAVTTRLAPLPPHWNRPLELPRLDAFYLAQSGVMERWGTGGFSRYIRLRRAARAVRRGLHRVGVG